jgi:hypothetical protein
MAGIMGAKAGDFDVVAEQVWILGNLVHCAAKELLLVIETRAPCEIRADLQILTHAMADHVGRKHAFGRLHIMRTTGRVNVMIAGPPAELRRVGPTLDFEFELPGIGIDGHLLVFGNGFGSTGEFDGIIAVGQFHSFAIATINLRMEWKIGREPFGLRRINATLRMMNSPIVG